MPVKADMSEGLEIVKELAGPHLVLARDVRTGNYVAIKKLQKAQLKVSKSASICYCCL